MRALRLVDRLLYETRPAVFGSVLLTLLVLKTGVWWVPNIVESARLAQNPFAPIPGAGEGSYITWSWLGSFIGWVFGLTGTGTFLILHGCFSVAFVAVMIALFSRRLDSRGARVALVLFVLLPGTGFVFYWIGQDSLTFLLWALILAFPSNLPVAAVLGLGLGMQHFEQASVGVGLLLLSALTARVVGGAARFPVRSTIVVGSGIVVGRLLLMYIFQANGMEPVTRGALAQERYVEFLAMFLKHVHVVLWGLLGVAWFVLVRHLDLGRRSLPVVLPLVAAILVVTAVADQSRVFAVITFPVIAVHWLLNPDFLSRLRRREVGLLFSSWLVLPYAWVWLGEPKWSVLPYDFMLLFNRLFGWFTIPDDIGNWPFF